jgi:hypothetical protein
MFTAIVAIVALAVGVTFATPIKDWAKGVPAAARAEADKLIAEAIAKVKGSA